MSQLALISFGHLHFIVPPKIGAAKLLETLNQCQIVEWDYDGDDSFYRLTDRESNTKLEFISAKKLRGTKVEPKPARKILRLEGGQS